MVAKAVVSGIPIAGMPPECVQTTVTTVTTVTIIGFQGLGRDGTGDGRCRSGIGYHPG
jgi:hypothetical protein